MSGLVRVLALRHAAFYTPLIGTLAGGFLKQEGLDGQYLVRQPDRKPLEMLQSGEVDIAQSAVSSSWARIEKGLTDLPLHFAQINQRDGFWITARERSSFEWKQLEGKTLLADHGPQPLAMLRYAADRQKVDWTEVRLINAGSPSEMDGAFRSGQGDFVHQQGPAPQQLERDGVGTVVASVGQAMPAVSFSTLTAMPPYLETPSARAFMRAYRRALDWVRNAHTEEIADSLSGYFEQFDTQVLEGTIAAYRQIGCWSQDPRIPEDLYEQALDVFEFNGAIRRRHPYRSVVVAPPA